MTCCVDYAIVSFAPGHVEPVWHIEKESFLDPWIKRSFIDELSAACGLNRIAVLADNVTVAGYCLAWAVADECTINRLAVHARYRRCGIATALLNDCLQHARARGAQTCFIEVRAGNSAALAFYDQLGFRRSGIRPGYYAAESEDAVLMQYGIACGAGADTNAGKE